MISWREHEQLYPHVGFFLLVVAVFEITNERRKSKRLISISSLTSSWRRNLLFDTLIYIIAMIQMTLYQVIMPINYAKKSMWLRSELEVLMKKRDYLKSV
jgi:hypothetical protein